jgi:hypothetical protein
MQTSSNKQQPYNLASRGSKTKIRFVLILVIIFPFINIFGQLFYSLPFFEDFSVSTCINYFSILISTWIVLQRKHIKYHKLFVKISSTLFFMLVLNFVMTPLASIKWFFNWLGFIYVSIVLIHTIQKFTQLELIVLEELSLKWLRALFSLLTIAIFIVWFANFSFLAEMIVRFQGDQVNNILAINLGIDKQALGTLLGLFVCMLAMYWVRLNKKDRLVFLIALVVFLPSMIFIRTMYLALFLTFAWLFLTKNQLRKWVTYFFTLLFFIFILLKKEQLTIILEDSYDRWPSLKFAWSAFSENIFGLGNGGYHIYVEQYQSQLIAIFGSESMIQTNLFWAAPESDLVYFIASWGILSILFFFYFLVILKKGAVIFHKQKEILHIDKILLLMSFLMIFSGISQDNASSLSWWIYIAAGSGVVLRHLHQSKLVIKIQQR